MQMPDPALLGLQPGSSAGIDETAVLRYVRGMGALNYGTAGGNTTCVEVRTGDKSRAAAEAVTLIDAGTGIRDLGLEMLKGPFGRGKGEVHILFSHPHWDHIQGFPFFLPAYIPGNRIIIYSVHDLEKALVDQQRYLNFPVPISAMEADIDFVRLEEGRPFTIGDMRINTIRNAHPGDSYGFRFEDGEHIFVFASDAEFKHLNDANMQPHIAFFEDADALIFDAQYTLGEGWVKEDWGHSSALIGVEMALAAGARQLVLFHHDPASDDTVLQRILADAEGYRDELVRAERARDALDIAIAYEGMVLDLAAGSAAKKRSAARRDRLEHTGPILIPAHVFDEQSVRRVAEQLLVLDDESVARGRIIDLSQVDTLTTASLKQLVELQNAPGQAPLVLAAPSPKALRVIQLGGFSDFFAIYPTVEAAQMAVAARESAQLPGHVLGKRFLIERVLERGRMGTVLLAGDQRTKGTVAVRIIDPAYSEDRVERLFSQRDILLAANHPHLVPIVEIAYEAPRTRGGIPYLVEQYSPGKTLDELLRRHLAQDPAGLPFDRAMEIALAVVSGIEYAHELGVVHGNLKDDKIFVDGRRIQIGGLGLGQLDEGLDLTDAPRLHQVVTYLAPEQVRGRPIGMYTDLYALGVLLYQLFSGRLPFEGDEREVLREHLEQEPPPLDAGLPLALKELIFKLLAKNPADRCDSVTAVRRDLQAVCSKQ